MKHRSHPLMEQLRSSLREREMSAKDEEMLAAGQKFKVVLPEIGTDPLYTSGFDTAVGMAKEYGDGAEVVDLELLLGSPSEPAPLPDGELPEDPSVVAGPGKPADKPLGGESVLKRVKKENIEDDQSEAIGRFAAHFTAGNVDDATLLKFGQHVDNFSAGYEADEEDEDEDGSELMYDALDAMREVLADLDEEFGEPPEPAPGSEDEWETKLNSLKSAPTVEAGDIKPYKPFTSDLMKPGVKVGTDAAYMELTPEGYVLVKGGERFRVSKGNEWMVAQIELGGGAPLDGGYHPSVLTKEDAGPPSGDPVDAMAKAGLDGGMEADWVAVGIALGVAPEAARAYFTSSGSTSDEVAAAHAKVKEVEPDIDSFEGAEYVRRLSSALAKLGLPQQQIDAALAPVAEAVKGKHMRNKGLKEDSMGRLKSLVGSAYGEMGYMGGSLDDDFAEYGVDAADVVSAYEQIKSGAKVLQGGSPELILASKDGANFSSADGEVESPTDQELAALLCVFALENQPVTAFLKDPGAVDTSDPGAAKAYADAYSALQNFLGGQGAPKTEADGEYPTWADLEAGRKVVHAGDGATYWLKDGQAFAKGGDVGRLKKFSAAKLKSFIEDPDDPLGFIFADESPKTEAGAEGWELLDPWMARDGEALYAHYGSAEVKDYDGKSMMIVLDGRKTYFRADDHESFNAAAASQGLPPMDEEMFDMMWATFEDYALGEAKGGMVPPVTTGKKKESPMKSKKHDVKKLREAVLADIRRESGGAMGVQTTVGKKPGVDDSGSGNLDRRGVDDGATNQDPTDAGSSTELPVNADRQPGEVAGGVPTLNDPMKGGMSSNGPDLSGAGKGKGAVGEASPVCKPGNLVKVFEATSRAKVDTGNVQEVSGDKVVLEGGVAYDLKGYFVQVVA